MLGALAGEPLLLENVLDSKDTVSMVSGLRALGFDFAWDRLKKEIYFSGLKKKNAADSTLINVGESGIAARFLPVVAALFPGEYRFQSSRRMEERPMAELLQVLNFQGNKIHFLGNPGAYPFVLESAGLEGGGLRIDVSQTTQFLSSFLIASSYAKSPTRLKFNGLSFSEPFVKMTVKMMQDWGADVIEEIDGYTINPIDYQLDKFFSGRYQIEPDATTASYFGALVALHGGSLRLDGANSWRLQQDQNFFKLLIDNGLEVLSQGEDWGLKSSGWRENARFLEIDFSQNSDTFLTYAALAPLMGSSVRLKGLRHTRLQECDRLSVAAESLERVGQEVKLFEDGLEIYPRPLRSAVIDPHGDHRVAMAFGILGTHDLYRNGDPWLTVLNPDSCSKTFPKFWQTIDDLRNS